MILFKDPPLNPLFIVHDALSHTYYPPNGMDHSTELQVQPIYKGGLVTAESKTSHQKTIKPTK